MREFLSALGKVEFDKVRQRIGTLLRTPMGVEHLGMVAPRTDAGWIQDELSLTSETRRVLEGGTPMPLRELTDVRTSLQRAAIVDFVLPPADLLAIAHLAASSRELKTFIASRAEEFPGLAGLVEPLQANKVLEFNILRAIDEDARVVDSASQALQTIRRSIRRKGEALREQMESILGTLHRKGITQEELITTRDGRLVIPVRAEYKNQVPGFIHSISASGATAFIEPTQTLEMNNDIRTLESQESQEVEKILRELTDQVRNALPALNGNTGIIGRLDFLNAKARHSIEIGGAQPRLAGERRLRIRDARHPLLLQKHRREEVVPLDIEAGEHFNTLIISGPNAGGKSVAMKTVGLLAAMVQSGCHVSASPDSEFCLFSELFVEMGDEQSIENDLSTFSSHVANLRTILEHATPGSLVLIDEIGNGTDPSLGSALGIAVLEALSERDCLTVVTSHHGAFKTAGFENERMENAGMGFDSESLKPNYRLSIGRPGNSYALEIARNMDFPDAVLQRSISLAGEDSVKLTDAITKFEERSNRLEEELRKVADRERQAGDIIRLYENKLARIEQEVKAMRSRASEEASALLETTKKRIEGIVREIRESGAAREVVRQAREEIGVLRVQHRAPETEAAPPFAGPLAPGMIVRLRGTGMAGEVIEVIDRKKVVIDSGGKRVVATVNSLEPGGSKTPEPLKSNEMPDFEKASNEIDLRGLYGDESIEMLDKFVDKAVLQHLTRIRIIHGKGTGALRKRVAEYLSRNRNVTSFQLGEWNEGGAGVTIANIGA